MKLLLFFTLIKTLLFSSDYFYYENGQKTQLTPISNVKRSITNSIEYYEKNNGSIVGVGDDILVKFKEFSQSIIDKYNLKIEKKYSHSLYLLSHRDSNNTLNLANQLYLESSVLYAHPNFRKKVRLR